MSQNRPPSGSNTPSWVIPAVVIAVILAGAIAFAGYEIGHRAASPKSTPTPTASTPTPTPSSAPSATPTSAPTSAVTATILPSTSTPVPTGTKGTQNVQTVDMRTIRNHGYVPNGRYAWISDGQGGRVYAWIATCTGSGDGYCQKVFFFHDTTWLGTDTSKPSPAVMAIAGQASPTPGISVKYANYKASDPMCCPKGKPISIFYSWNGSKLTPNGTAP